MEILSILTVCFSIASAFREKGFSSDYFDLDESNTKSNDFQSELKRKTGLKRQLKHRLVNNQQTYSKNQPPHLFQSNNHLTTAQIRQIYDQAKKYYPEIVNREPNRLPLSHINQQDYLPIKKHILPNYPQGLGQNLQPSQFIDSNGGSFVKDNNLQLPQNIPQLPPVLYKLFENSMRGQNSNDNQPE